jgi:tRNA modification GTPase
MPAHNDTIAAIATPSGRGGLGIIRVSGSLSTTIFNSLTGGLPAPRLAKYVSFKGADQKTIDKGIALFFKAPASYTGEDVMECHVHGSRIILGLLLEEIISLGARAAMPGEFTERAFLNNKIDLVQAEAVADLIDSNSKKAARSAMQSLDGVFSNSINQLRDRVFNAKALIEAALDFPDEEDVVINTAPAAKDIQACLDILNDLLNKAEAGRVLDQNPTIVIAGKPNAGKSSIINYLSGVDAAIVSTTPGTTRDIIKEKVLLGGYAVTLLDTAGIRESNNEIEKAGVDKAHKALGLADIIIYVHDNSQGQFNMDSALLNHVTPGTKILVARNKIDLCENYNFVDSENEIYVSVKTSEGMDKLIETICLNLEISGSVEDLIFARQRHIDGLKLIGKNLQCVLSDIESGVGLEVQAESLRQCLAGFDELTGKITSDDVLGAVFSQFCIGK